MFCPLLSSSEHSGVPEDSKSPLFQVLGFTLTLDQVRVATDCVSSWRKLLNPGLIKSCWCWILLWVDWFLFYICFGLWFLFFFVFCDEHWKVGLGHIALWWWHCCLGAIICICPGSSKCVGSYFRLWHCGGCIWQCGNLVPHQWCMCSCKQATISHGNVENCGRTCSWDATCLGFGTARSKLSQNETQIFGFSRANNKYIAWWFYIVNSWQTLERSNQCFQLLFQMTLKKHEGNEQRGSFSIQACQTKWFYCPVVCCSQL